MLAVGQWIDKTSSLGDNSELTDAYNSSYKNLLLCENSCKSIEAFIGDISTILNGFLKNMVMTLRSMESLIEAFAPMVDTHIEQKE